MSASLASRANADLIDQKYAEWKEDPASVGADWASFFEGFELGLTLTPAQNREAGGEGGKNAIAAGGISGGDSNSMDLKTRARIVSLVYNYRTLGHTAAHLNPLENEAPDPPEFGLEALGFLPEHLSEEISTQFYKGGESMKLGELIDRLKKTYCDRVGFEFMHIHKAEVRNWIRERVESRIDSEAPTSKQVEQIFTWLTEAESFEQFLHRKYVGQKRFSLEGGESLMVALNGILDACPQSGVSEIVMGMAHRGRLNVLANLLRKPLKVLLYEFTENYVPNLVAGDGDVKYHLGFDAVRRTDDDKVVKIHLGANPSHLEAVNGVIEGKARALQRARDPKLEDSWVDRSEVLPILIHGDAAFAGQGSVAETLNLSQLLGYRTGGTIHIVVNNQIGFTTMPEDARSSHYCTDVAKMIDAPVIHVNGDSPFDVLFATRFALEFRQKFKRDIVLDIVCYRRHGHNEGDEPAFTQPKTYRNIRAHDSTATLFQREAIAMGLLTHERANEIADGCRNKLEAEQSELEAAQAAGDRSQFSGSTADAQPPYSHDPILTGVERENLLSIGMAITGVPDGVNVNQKLAKRFLGPRREAIERGDSINWAFAEALAFGSIIKEGKAVRLSGQDVRRGTFSHRHAVLYDPDTRERYIPLNHLDPEQKAKLWVYNSLLSEFAVLGFEYGYSLVTPDMLVLWEAQFGDFANGAQVIIDQFISSAESKWQRASSLVMLLPHGYEGQGPEHSSARLERFLQLCAEDNMHVCNLSTPAQYFHVLRRQMVRDQVRKPLIIMTPKSLLTHSECVSSLEDMDEGTSFQEVIDDANEERGAEQDVNRVIFCSGKVYYDLLDYRRKEEIKRAAIVRVEQFYPFHREAFEKILSRYSNATKVVWCQEEPLNMGGWSFIGPRLQKLTSHKVRYAGRDTAASPSTGAKAIHKAEQKKLVHKAFHA